MDLNTSATMNIVISHETVAAKQGNPSNPESPVKDPAQDKKVEEAQETGWAAFRKSSEYAMIANLGKQALRAATSRVGQVTRDSNKQQLVNLAGQIAGTAATFAVNPYVGAATLGVTSVTSLLDYSFGYTRAEYARQIALERAGRSNRSR